MRVLNVPYCGQCAAIEPAFTSRGKPWGHAVQALPPAQPTLGQDWNSVSLVLPARPLFELNLLLSEINGLATVADNILYNTL